MFVRDPRPFHFQIIEMQDLGIKLRMVVMAHRRISIVKKIDEAVDAKDLTTAPPGEPFVEMPTPLSSTVKTSEDGVLVAETENLIHEPFETTDEIKALTQEVIKTIRDIIVSLANKARGLNCYSHSE